MRTLADECLKGYTTLRNSGAIQLVGFSGESMTDLVRLGVTPSGVYCVQLERLTHTTGQVSKGFAYCGTNLGEATLVYFRHVGLRVG